MDSYQIYKNADRLVQHYGTNDPIELCDDMGIMLRDEPDFTDLLGMFLKKMVTMAGRLGPAVSLGCLVVTVKTLDPGMIRMLKECEKWLIVFRIGVD